jgi:hypothetical protein
VSITVQRQHLPKKIAFRAEEHDGKQREWRGEKTEHESAHLLSHILLDELHATAAGDVVGVGHVEEGERG